MFFSSESHIKKFNYKKKSNIAEFVVELATIVNVPFAVNVCIVCHPLVVIVPPVEDVETPSDPLVAYEIITIPDHQAAQVVLTEPPPPQPEFAVPLVPAPAAPQ